MGDQSKMADGRSVALSEPRQEKERERKQSNVLYVIVAYRKHYERLEPGRKPESNGLQFYCNCCLFRRLLRL